MAPRDTIDRATLRVYLRDHLAASVAAIRLLRRMCDSGAATPLGSQLTEITSDVIAEQDVLRTLLRRVGGDDRGFAVALAWLGEKLSRLKLGPGKPWDSGLQLFETLEAISNRAMGKPVPYLEVSESEEDRLMRFAETMQGADPREIASGILGFLRGERGANGNTPPANGNGQH